MKYYYAPMEGITDMVYRCAHHRHYPGMDRYYTPFVSPTQNHFFTPRELRELSPENNACVPLVPQLLGKNAEDFLWAVNALADMGYKEVNFNLGCPSATVTAKGKGSGFLAQPEALDAFLDKVYGNTPIAISIKSRLGMENPDEFERILEIYNRYPVAELILHPRTRKEMYREPVHPEMFRYTLEHASMPVAYNGDLFTASQIDRFRKEFPSVDRLMLGRGLAADPGMVTKLHGGDTSKKKLEDFHNELCQRYPVVFENDGNALQRMKALWRHLLPCFAGGSEFHKALTKTKHWPDFLLITKEIFRQCDLL